MAWELQRCYDNNRFIEYGDRMRLQSFELVVVLAAVMAPVHAQWFNYPERRTPMTPAGQPNLSAKPPRLRGKPDLSGVWQIEPPPAGELERLFGGRVDKQAEGDDPRTLS